MHTSKSLHVQHIYVPFTTINRQGKHERVLKINLYMYNTAMYHLHKVIISIMKHEIKKHKTLQCRPGI